MPTYDYGCPRCGGFDAIRPLAARNEPCACPRCGEPAPRVLSAAPMTALLDRTVRAAHATNERAANEPRHAGRRHAPGCGCCVPGAARRRVFTGANGLRGFPGRRPWQISH